MNTSTITRAEKVNLYFDWPQITRWVMTSRAMDALEEIDLWPRKKINYQFSARGHELGQVLLGSLLTHQRDRGGPGRRGVGGDERLLVGAHDRHDAQTADAFLRRRQRLFAIGAGRAANSGRGYCQKLELLYKSFCPRRGRYGSRRSVRADQ